MVSGVAWAGRGARLLLGVTAHPGGEALTQHLLDRLDLGPGDRVADIACGRGRTLRLLVARGLLPVGIDVQPGPGAVRGDAHALPLRSGSCDAVLCECSVSTFADPLAAVREMARVVRPGGLVAVTDVVLDRARAAPEVVAALDALTSARTTASYAALLEQAGLRVRSSEDRSGDAAALVARLRRRLPLSRRVRACAQAVLDGTLGYVLLVAERPDDPSRP